MSTEPKPAERWVSTTEAARILGCHRRTVTIWAREGKFRYRDDLGRELRIWLPDLIPNPEVSHGSWCFADRVAVA